MGNLALISTCVPLTTEESARDQLASTRFGPSSVSLWISLETIFYMGPFGLLMLGSDAKKQREYVGGSPFPQSDRNGECERNEGIQTTKRKYM